jgi:hypothetical protein
VLTLETGVVTYCVFVVFSAALLKSGLRTYAQAISIKCEVNHT